MHRNTATTYHIISAMCNKAKVAVQLYLTCPHTPWFLHHPEANAIRGPIPVASRCQKIFPVEMIIALQQQSRDAKQR